MLFLPTLPTQHNRLNTHTSECKEVDTAATVCSPTTPTPPRPVPIPPPPFYTPHCPLPSNHLHLWNNPCKHTCSSATFVCPASQKMSCSPHICSSPPLPPSLPTSISLCPSPITPPPLPNTHKYLTCVWHTTTYLQLRHLGVQLPPCVPLNQGLQTSITASRGTNKAGMMQIYTT
jgi:hypothetical protein